MFCGNCGTEVPEGSRFCPNCGAMADGTGETFAPEERLEQDPSLPEGIFQDGNGAYHWVYHLDMLRNPVPLYTVFKIFFWIDTGLALFLFALDLIEGNGLSAALRSFAIVFFGINALFFVLGLIAWLIMAATRGARYTVEHRMDGNAVAYIMTPEESEKRNKAATAAMLAGALSGNVTAMGVGLSQSAGGEVFSSRYSDVKAVIARRRLDLIKVNSTLRRNQIYAYPHQYEFVWKYIVEHCPDAKIRI